MLRFRRSRTKVKVLLARLMGQPREVVLRHKFNLYAESWARTLEPAHIKIAQKAWNKMGISSGDRILELGCGNGWASRVMAGAVGDAGLVVGLDVSDQMIGRAWELSSQYKNVRFTCSSAEQLRFQDSFFTKAFSLEAFYYFEHQDKVLRELLRVVAPQGQLFLAFCFYKDYPEGLAIRDALDVPLQIRSAAEYKELLQATGWSEAHAEEFVMEYEPGRKPKVHARTLFLSATKPSA